MSSCLKTTVLYLFVIFSLTGSFAQSAIMDVASNNQGVLLPRMTLAQRNNISNPAHSLIIYQTNGESGFYFNQGSPTAPDWQPFIAPPTTPCESRTPIEALPYNITSSGSYFVTSHLIGTSGTSGITISTSNVSIDLNGFTLLSGGGTTGSGIIVSTAADNIQIYNGNIQGWGDEGITAVSASNSSFQNLRLKSNQHDGLQVGDNNLIINCQSTSNAIDGIDAGKHCTLINCIASSNGDDGIETDQGCAISFSNAYLNSDDGINAGISNTISNTQASNNSDRGMNIMSGSTISNNTAENNGTDGFNIGSACIVDKNTSRNNSENGFSIAQDAIVTNNVADGNDEVGFETFSSRVRFERNQSTTNGTHGFNIQGLENCIIIKNTAMTNTVSNYSIAVGHSAGPIIGPSLAGASNPFSNISL